jgi:hypothetical protein
MIDHHKKQWLKKPFNSTLVAFLMLLVWVVFVAVFAIGASV